MSDYKPAVLDGRLSCVRASDLKTWTLCNLKWWFDNVKHLPRRPESKGIVTGKKGHKEIEEYLLTGHDARGEHAAKGRGVLEPYAMQMLRGAPVEVEAFFSVPFGNVTLQGQIDLALPGEWVVDHKFSSDPKRYGHTPETALQDWQTRLYTYVKRATKMAFHYYPTKTKTKPAYEVAVAVDEEYHYQTACLLSELLPQLDAAAGNTDFDAVTPVKAEGACQAFGGCDFAASCRFSPSYVPPKKEIEMPSLAELRAARAAAVASTPPAAEVPTPQTLLDAREVAPPVSYAPAAVKAAEEPLPRRRGAKAGIFAVADAAEIEKRVGLTQDAKIAAPSAIAVAETKSTPDIVRQERRQLHINVRPANAVDLTHALSAIVDRVEAELQVKDIRLAGGDFGFGKWPAAVAIATRAELEASAGVWATVATAPVLYVTMTQRIRPAVETLIESGVVELATDMP